MIAEPRYIIDADCDITIPAAGLTIVTPVLLVIGNWATTPLVDSNAAVCINTVVTG